MEKLRRISLYGNSIILGTMAESLQCCSQFEVVVLTPPLPGAQELAKLKPDVVLFDLEAARPEAAFSLLENYPHLTLIGISPDANLVKVWSGKQLRELSTRDLLKVIDEQVKDSTLL
jgi:hypothetical protein